MPALCLIMPIQDTSKIKEKILFTLRRRGPCLPVRIASEIGNATPYLLPNKPARDPTIKVAKIHNITNKIDILNITYNSL